MDKTQVISLFVRYGFNVSADVLTFILEENLSQDQLLQILERLPQNVSIISDLRLFEEHVAILRSQQAYEASHKQSVSSSEPQETESQDEIEESVSVVAPEEIPPKVPSISPKMSPPIISVKRAIPAQLSESIRIQDFRELFLDRYKRLSQILVNRLAESTTILKRKLTLDDIPLDRDGTIIGMVHDTRVLHSGKFVVQLEDMASGAFTNCVMVKESKSFPEYRKILRDTVVAISGELPKNFNPKDVAEPLTALWGKDIHLPSFTPLTIRHASSSRRVLFLSDFHYGTESFAQGAFNNLIRLLTLDKVPSPLQNLVHTIDTIIIAGDLVDGVGQFADQKQHVTVPSLRTQYDELAALLQKIPSYIEIIVIPGEHDATQSALPQPAIDRNIGQALFSLPNVRSYGNPLYVTINDINYLIYHGQGIETLLPDTEELDAITVLRGMEHLLEYRHLCPEYGSMVPLNPATRDYLVIDEIPDVIVAGHYHRAAFHEYKGVKIVLGGTFQRKSQKKEQLKMRSKPSVGIVPCLETSTGQMSLIDLTQPLEKIKINNSVSF